MKTTAMVMIVMMLAGAAGAQVQVELKGAATLPAGEIRLGTVATVHSGDAAMTERFREVSLGATPYPGNGRVVTRDQVVMHLVRAGVDITPLRWQGAEACTVTVQTSKVTGEQIVQAARAYLAGLPVLRRDDVKMDIDQVPRDQLLAGSDHAVTLAASAAGVDRPWGRVRVFVRVLMDDKLVATVPVQFQISSRQKVMVAARGLGKGDTVERAMMEEREVVLGAATENDQFIENPADVIGKKLVRAVAAGTPLTAALVSEPQAIRRGESVSILLRSEHMEVLAKGVAQRDGCVGETVPIKVMLSGKDVTCKVLANGTVELPL